MDVIATVKSQTVDCRMCMASIAGIYAPILILTTAALFAF